MLGMAQCMRKQGNLRYTAIGCKQLSGKNVHTAFYQLTTVAVTAPEIQKENVENFKPA